MPFAHTVLGRALVALARCACCRARRAEALLSVPAHAGRGSRTPEVVDGLELDVRREAVGTADEARGAARVDARGDRLAAGRPSVPSDALAWQARRLFAAPHRAGARPRCSSGEELDATALATLLRALAELGELGERPSGAELIELLEELEVEQRRRLPARRGADRRAARDPRPAVPGGVRVRASGGRVPAAGDARAVPHRRAPVGAGCAPPGLALRSREDALAPRALPVLRCVSRATEQLVLSYRSSDEEGNLELPSPFIADVADLLVEGWPERRERRLLADVVWGRPTAPTAARARAVRSGGAGPGVGRAARPGEGADGRGAPSRPPPRGGVRRGAREVRRLPGQVAGRAAAGARAARARARPAAPWWLHPRGARGATARGWAAR